MKAIRVINDDPVLKELTGGLERLKSETELAKANFEEKMSEMFKPHAEAFDDFIGTQNKLAKELWEKIGLHVQNEIKVEGYDRSKDQALEFKNGILYFFDEEATSKKRTKEAKEKILSRLKDLPYGFEISEKDIQVTEAGQEEG